ncbi:MAG: chorismate mutase [Alphaproteobacteria bacterium]|nr:chorismate mutase [Alphaproteobacteria bacterium]
MLTHDNVLLELRTQIDAIDDQIISLLKDRLAIVDQVGRHKKEMGINGCFLKPGREAAILKRVVMELRPHFPDAAIASMWRMIISASLFHEQKLKVSVFGGDESKGYWLAREYFGSFVPINKHVSIGSVLSDVEKNDSVIGVVPLHWQEVPNHYWWQNLKDNVSVFAVLPVVCDTANEQKSVLALGKVKPEPTGDDSTLLVLNTPLTVSKNTISKALQSIKISAEWIAQSPTPGDEKAVDHLIKVSGFIQQYDPLLTVISKELDNHMNYIKRIGAYANPIVTI